MPVKRLRIFAGPNGSGKSSLIERVKDIIPLGVYINADEIEKTLRKGNKLDFSDYQISITDVELKAFFKDTGFSMSRINQPLLLSQMQVMENVLHFDAEVKINSYIAADIAEFIRQKLIQAEISFTFETVLSHPAKLDLLKEAKANNFKVYLYYIATEDPDINVNRVQIRVAQDGHDVDKETIVKRYYRSLDLLYDTIKLSNRAFLFDNSDTMGGFFAEITNGKDVEIYGEVEDVPAWFGKYVADKNS